ncbi:MAG: AAA family ATPase [Nitrososphaeraceae archaeon]|nr:AAA family ATPase [Nitrososphaeraceae archaeon]
MIIIICGLPGTGKSFLANTLSKRINAVVLSTDKIRKELLHKPRYSLWERSLIYDLMYLIAKYLNSAGINCILDGTFNQQRSRDEVMKKLNLKKKDLFIIECTCPEDIIMSRLMDRKNDFSDANPSIYFKMKQIYEKVVENHLTIDTSKSLQNNLANIMEFISSK